MNALLAAVALLTIVPIRRALNFNARAFTFFPLVGALIGVVLTTAFLILRLVFPPLVTAAVIVTFWALLTGALHLDGVSDAFDGLLAATTRERRLEILKDVHVGAFGATGLVLVLLLKFAALNDVTCSRSFSLRFWRAGQWSMPLLFRSYGVKVWRRSLRKDSRGAS